ncbi:MAG: hypothetical protein U1F49_13375 [Rubrivivax sp.]
MVEPLSVSDKSFMQDLAPWVAARRDCPGARRMESMRVVVVRHFEGSQGAQAAFAQAGLAWPERTLDLEVAGELLVVRRHPEEVILIGENHPALANLLSALTPGRDPEAMAIEVTHGLGVVELQGPRLDDWLARLVDRSSMPAAGQASHCRLVDVAVLLIRPERNLIRLVADRSLFPYLAHWLAFAHEGAFADS